MNCTRKKIDLMNDDVSSIACYQDNDNCLDNENDDDGLITPVPNKKLITRLLLKSD